MIELRLAASIDKLQLHVHAGWPQAQPPAWVQEESPQVQPVDLQWQVSVSFMPGTIPP